MSTSGTTLTSIYPAPYSQSGWFGRAWKVSVLPQDVAAEKVTGAAASGIVISNSDWGTEAVRIKFDTLHTAMAPYWSCDVTIYNVSAVTEQRLIQGPNSKQPSNEQPGNLENVAQGDQVTVAAGYQATFDPNHSIIWQGEVFQPLWERENVTDYKVILRCVIGWLDGLDFIAFSLPPLSSQNDVLAWMASHYGTRLSQIDRQLLSEIQLPRGRTVFGRSLDVMREIAADHTKDLAQLWGDIEGTNLRAISADPTIQPSITYAPMSPPGDPLPKQKPGGLTETLIGTPQQTQFGVIFTVLLDPRLKIGDKVGLSEAAVRLIEITPLSNTIMPPRLSQDGTYVVVAVRHHGDTRGQEWYSEVTGVTSTFMDTWMGTKGLI